jgi:hypothetical protein
LDSSQKNETWGFDAIVLIFDKKHQEKAERTDFRRIITGFGYRHLNYPDNLNSVGNDTTRELSEEDAIFFNKIFQFQRNSFDFRKKKVAFVNTNEIDRRKSIKTKQEYIQRIKKVLEEDFLFQFDAIHILTEREKNESGGYDAIIIFQCKKCSQLDAIRILKQGGT